MSTKKPERVHYFHADAVALGGSITTPVQKNIDVQASLSLAPVGGFAARTDGAFNLHEIVSTTATRSQVSGHRSDKGSPLTMSTSVTEGLNVLNVVTARRAVAQIASEHPPEGGPARVKFLGTHFEDLRVQGNAVEVILDTDVFGHGDDGKFPKLRPIHDKQLLKRVCSAYSDKNGNFVCSLVKEIEGFPGKIEKPNVLIVPDFGRVVLAELVVSYHTYALTMIRFELGCPTQGTMSVSATKVNGDGTGG